jgi:hypothetical protein
MKKKDILSKFFSDYFVSREDKKHFNSSYSKKKRNHLKRLNIFYTENNLMKFSPNNIFKLKLYNNTYDNYSNLYKKHSTTLKELTKNSNRNPSINCISSKNSIDDTESCQLNSKHNKTNNTNTNGNDKIFNNNISGNIKNKENKSDIFHNKTTSTNFNSTHNNTIYSYKDKINKKIENKGLSFKQRNKGFNQKEINKRADKIVDYYMNSDFTPTIKDINNEKKKNNTCQIDRVKKFENEKRKRILYDSKLLKMQNIKHRLMLGNNRDFKSINIQIMALGSEKNRRKLLKGVQDFYKDKTFKSLKVHLRNDNQKYNYIRKHGITEGFEFDKYEKRKNKSHSERKNRIMNINSLKEAKLKMNKIAYMNFYQSMDHLCDEIKNTFNYIQKNIKIRRQYKDNLNHLFISEKDIEY